MRRDARRSITASVASRLLRLADDTARIKSPSVKCERRAVFRGLFMPVLKIVFRAIPHRLCEGRGSSRKASRATTPGVRFRDTGRIRQITQPPHLLPPQPSPGGRDPPRRFHSSAVRSAPWPHISSPFARSQFSSNSVKPTPRSFQRIMPDPAEKKVGGIVERNVEALLEHRRREEAERKAPDPAQPQHPSEASLNTRWHECLFRCPASWRKRQRRVGRDCRYWRGWSIRFELR